MIIKTKRGNTTITPDVIRNVVSGIVVIVCMNHPVAFTDVTVTVDTNTELLASRFEMGTTHTQGGWENGNAVAVARAKQLLVDGMHFQNQHIIGWGPDDINPSAGTYAWSTLDSRIDLLRSMNATMVITFCTAPGWMKTSGNTRAMEEAPSPAHYGDFAHLCKLVVRRYSDVVYFQVWNELKGFWNSSLNNWDYIAFTQMYNMVWDSVKSERPDAKLGGPYIVMQGTGSLEFGFSGADTEPPIQHRDSVFIAYFLTHKKGMDFFTFDWSLTDYHDPNTYSDADKMNLTKHIGSIGRQLREDFGVSEPIWVSEFYGGMSGGVSSLFTMANHASCYRHCIINKMDLGLQWNPQEGEINNPLFTSTATSGGGQPTPHYQALKLMNDHFGPGTKLYKTTVSATTLEVLASATKVLLINKDNAAVTALVNGVSTQLAAYDVTVIDFSAPTSTRLGHSAAAPGANSLSGHRWFDFTGRRLYIGNSHPGTVAAHGIVVIGDSRGPGLTINTR